MNKNVKIIISWVLFGLIVYFCFDFYLSKNPEKTNNVPDYVLVLPIGYLVYLLIKKLK